MSSAVMDAGVLVDSWYPDWCRSGGRVYRSALSRRPACHTTVITLRGFAPRRSQLCVPRVSCHTRGTPHSGAQ